MYLAVFVANELELINTNGVRSLLVICAGLALAGCSTDGSNVPSPASVPPPTVAPVVAAPPVVAPSVVVPTVSPLPTTAPPVVSTQTVPSSAVPEQNVSAPAQESQTSQEQRDDGHSVPTRSFLDELNEEKTWPGGANWPFVVKTTDSTDLLRRTQVEVRRYISICDDVVRVAKIEDTPIKTQAMLARSDLEALDSCIDARLDILEGRGGSQWILNSRLDLILPHDIIGVERYWNQMQRAQ